MNKVSYNAKVLCKSLDEFIAREELDQHEYEEYEILIQEGF
jgi:hypothetical protein